MCPLEESSPVYYWRDSSLLRRVVSVSASSISPFLFQAEDVIRDLVRSRGLGDVYKRQPKPCAAGNWGPSAAIALIERDGRAWRDEAEVLSLIHI